MVRTTAADAKDPQLSSLYAEVGAHIKKIRVTVGLTQEQLSVRSGVNRKYIVQIEKLGLNLTLQLMHQLATGLGVKLQDILNFSNANASDAELRIRLMTAQVVETLGSIQSIAKAQVDSLVGSAACDLPDRIPAQSSASEKGSNGRA